MIILDTDIVSELMRRNPAPRVLARLRELPVEEQATTAITIGEIAYGAHKAGRPELLDRALTLLAGVRVLHFDQAAAERYGRIRSLLELTERRLADPDLRIAAIALAHDATLATGNVRHFARVPDLRVEDWLHAAN